MGRTHFTRAGETRWSFYPHDGSLALLIVRRDEIIAKTTVCMPLRPCGDDAIWLKTWSAYAGIPAALAQAGVVDLTCTYAKCPEGVAQNARLTAASRIEIAVQFHEEPNLAQARALALRKMRIHG